MKTSTLSKGVLLLGLLAIGYYFYSQPYVITTPSLTITAAFPGKPTYSEIPSLSPGGDSSVSYQLIKPGSTYSVSITSVTLAERQRLGDSGIFKKYFNSLSLAGGTPQGLARIALMGPFNGQTVSLSNQKNTLYGKYFLTSGGLVSIIVKVEGPQMTVAGMDFVNSLTITSRNDL